MSTASAPAGKSLIARLGAMMFAEFFIWGVWYATLGLVLVRHGLKSVIGNAFSVGPIASIVSPFLLGLLVDRYFASQRVLGVLHLAGALLLWLVPARLTAGDGQAVLALLLAYMLCYMPTVALTNNVAFHALGTRRARFPLVRVFGTAGWIAAGVGIGLAGWSGSAEVFRLAAIASALLGAYSFTLPDTPPAERSLTAAARGTMFRDALTLLRRPHFMVFAICATLISVPLATYYAFSSPFLDALGIGNVAGLLALGQVSEVACMLLIPLLFRRLGVKYMLLIGMLAWCLRYAAFSLGIGDETRLLILLGVLLHGVCYDFFFVVGFMYTDAVAGERTKGQAQGLVVLLTYGLGMLLGSQAAQHLFDRVVGSGATTIAAWRSFWWWPAIAALAVAAVFAAFFRYDDASPADAPGARA